MRLLIISDTCHYRKGTEIFGWGSTVQEFNHLAPLFTSVRHVACFYSGNPPKSCLPYTADNLELVGVTPKGGRRLRDKVGILLEVPRYLALILREMREADIVHVRSPANIALIALITLAFVSKPKNRWIKYAGNWKPERVDNLSYTFQRWWLSKGLTKSEVTVNGKWPQQPDYIHSFFNPCLSDEELENGKVIASGKALSDEVRLLFVGALVEAKGSRQVIELLKELRAAGVNARLDLAGDSDQRETYESLAASLGIAEYTTFHGWVRRDELEPLLSTAHFMVLPTKTEGWPKVLSEAMAYGVVPLAGAVSAIPQYLAQFGCGVAFEKNDPTDYKNAICEYVATPDRWKKESDLGLIAANKFSYANHIEAVKKLLKL